MHRAFLAFKLGDEHDFELGQVHHDSGEKISADAKKTSEELK
jgi:hypothetical protein